MQTLSSKYSVYHLSIKYCHGKAGKVTHFYYAYRDVRISQFSPVLEVIKNSAQLLFNFFLSNAVKVLLSFPGCH